MGQLIIEASGSFKRERKTFSVMKHGHAHAVAEAIAFLADTVLPEAIANDHEAQRDGESPEGGFRKR